MLKFPSSRNDICNLATQRVTVIIVTFNSRDVVGAAIESVYAGVNIIVVDNASSDGTSDYVSRTYPQVEVIRNTRNIGFGRANNIGLASVKTEFALLMNPDARLLTVDTIDRLVDAADSYTDAAILSPAIVDECGRLVLTLLPSVLSRNKTNIAFDMEAVGGDVCADAVSGALMLLRMESFRGAPQFFDPNIFMYYEDDDICMGARKRGCSAIYLPGISVMHLLGRSSRPSLDIEYLKTKHRTCSYLYVLTKYGRGSTAALLSIKYLLRGTWSILGYSVLLNKKKLLISLSKVSGALRYLTGRYKIVGP